MKELRWVWFLPIFFKKYFFYIAWVCHWAMSQAELRLLSVQAQLRHAMREHWALCLFSKRGLEPRSWAMQVRLEYLIMIWPRVCKLPEPNIGKRRGKVPPALCVRQVRLRLLTHSSKSSAIINPAKISVKASCSAAGEGAMHRLLPFAFVLNTFHSIPAKAECKEVEGARAQQGLRSQSPASGYVLRSHGMTSFHF